MDIEQLTDQIELLSKTIREKDSRIEELTRSGKESESLKEQIKSLSEQIEPLKKQAAEANVFKAKLSEAKRKEEDSVLAKEFPRIKDFGILAGDTVEVRRESAKKLYAALGVDFKAEPKKDEKPADGEPKKSWDDAGNLSQPSAEEQAKAAKEKIRMELNEAMKKGDTKAALKLSMAAQPNAVAQLNKQLLGGVK